MNLSGIFKALSAVRAKIDSLLPRATNTQPKDTSNFIPQNEGIPKEFTHSKKYHIVGSGRNYSVYRIFTGTRGRTLYFAGRPGHAPLSGPAPTINAAARKAEKVLAQ